MTQDKSVVEDSVPIGDQSKDESVVEGSVPIGNQSKDKSVVEDSAPIDDQLKVEELFEFVKKLIDVRRETVYSAKLTYSRLHENYSIGIAILAAFNGFAIAMSQFGATPNENWAVLALVLSALIAIASGWEASTKPREKFGQNAEVLNEIIDIAQRLEYEKKCNRLSLKKIDDFFEKFRLLEKQLFSNITRISVQDSGKDTVKS